MAEDGVSPVCQVIDKNVAGMNRTFGTTNTGMRSLSASMDYLGETLQTGGTRVRQTSADIQQAESRLNSLSRSANAAQNVMMNFFGVFMGGAVLQQVGQFATQMSVSVEDAQSTFKFMGESADSVKKFTDNVTEYAAAASKVSMGDMMTAWKMVRLQSKTTTEEMAQLNPVMGDIIAQFVANGRDASAAAMAIADGLTGQMRRFQEIGITKTTLTDTGLWKGTTEDVKGFFAALDKIDKDRGLQGIAMKADSTADKWNMATEQMQLAAKTIGDDILPYINKALDFFLNLLQEGYGPMIAWGVVLGGLGLAMMFIIPFFIQGAVSIALLTQVMRGNLTFAEMMETVAYGSAAGHAANTVAVDSEAASTAVLTAEMVALNKEMGLNAVVSEASAVSMTELALAEDAVTASSVPASGALARLKAQAVGLWASLGPLLVIAGALALAWELYSYANDQSNKVVVENKKIVADTTDKYFSLNNRLDQLHTQMKEGQKYVYDPEKKKWVEIKTAIKNTNDELDKTFEKRKAAYQKIMQEQAKWNDAGRVATLGLAPIPRKSWMGKMAETSNFSSYQKEQMEQAGLVIEDEEAWDKKVKDKFEKKYGAMTKWTDKQTVAYNKELTAQRNVSREQLKALGFNDKEIDQLYNLQAKKKDVQKAQEKLKNSTEKLETSLVKLLDAFIRLITGQKKSDDKTKTSQDPVDDLSTSIDDLSDSLDGAIGFIDWITGLIDGFNQKVKDATDFVNGLTDAFYKLPGQVAALFGGGNVNLTTGESGANKTVQNLNHGGGGSNIVSTINQKLNSDNGALFSTNNGVPQLKNDDTSYLRMEIGGKKVAEFPQVRGLISRLNRLGKPEQLVQAGVGMNHAVNYHEHKYSVVIDAKTFTLKELMGAITQINEMATKSNKQVIANSEGKS